MHTLFSTDAQFNHGDMMNQTIQRVRDISLVNLGRSQEYFRRLTFNVQNNHVIMRLLKNIKLPANLTQLSVQDVRKYYDEVRQRDYRLANVVGMTSSTAYGTINKSCFYPTTVMEIIIATSSTYEEAKIIPWMDLEPIQVHRHPYDTSNYGLLDRRQIMGGDGVAVISVNVPVLALQWLQFNMLIAREKPKVVPTIAQFVASFPIQNMVKSHNDIAMINRTIKAYRGIKGHSMNPRQPFWLLDDLVVADEVIKRLVPELKRTPRYWESILMHMPTLTRTGYEAIRLPIDIDVRQNRWAWIMARTWIIDFLLEIEYSFNRGQLEGTMINEIQKDLQIIKSDNTFRISGMPDKISKVINAELASIGTRIKNKNKK